MALSLDDVKRVAYLARIEISDSEAKAALEQLSNIFQLIEQMQGVDTKDITPMSHAQDVTMQLRTDEVTESNHRDEFLAIAPQAESGLYLIPKVIE